ncbi:Tetratricopeptide repeat-containing protein [Lutibacter flavus]|uniref:Tetratricopeptide repeat-containing protein n=2 Tax=Lutibacter flavus TaxID=691689 RepID=A0A238ZGK2_9FLAO|nr:Tetratricopeptide repeat-containing protein [Lutibacter flavus]
MLIVVLKTEAQSSVFTVIDDLLLKGDYQKALVLLEKEEPITVEVLDKMASIYQTIGDYTKAIEFYNKALDIEKNEALKVKLGLVYNSAGLTTNAIALYEEIIEKDTSNLLVANSLGKLYLGQNKAKKAEKMFRFLKKKDALNPNYPYQLAEALSKQNKPFKMGQSYLDSYNLDTLHIKSIYELSKFFKELRRKDSTMLFIDKGLKIDSTNVNFLQLKVNELYFSKNFDETLIYLNKLDSLDFRSVNTYEMFGMCYFNLNDFEFAETSFKKALKIERNNPKILYRLATLYYEKKDVEKAKHYLMMSIFSAKPEIDKQYFLLGTIFKEENDLKMALNNFEKSRQNNYHNYKALFEVATTSDTYFKDKKIAYNHYKKYFQQFESRDVEMTKFVKRRIKELKKELFLKGEIID